MVAMVLAIALGPAACSSPASSPPGRRLPVNIRDFRITPSSSTIRGGSITFVVQDQGPSTHEFLVIRTDLTPDGLPLRPDGLTVEEDSPLIHVVGEIGDLDVGDTIALSLRLSPGRYVLFCNLEGHYLGGMHALFEVGSDAPQP
jgi:uncharacterized cupredoxin-like copper-binding protein